MKRRASLALALAGFMAAGCGGSAPAVQAPDSESTAPPPVSANPTASKPKRTGMSVQTELGEIDRAATEKVFEASSGALRDCYRKGQTRVEYLAGDVALFVRVGQDGQARYAYAEESTLGDRETETCMLRVLRTARWPAPQGGEAEVRKKLSFDAGDVRAPADWSPDKVAPLLAKADDAAKCKASAPGTYRITLYVKPDGKARQVEAAGVAPPSETGEARGADCLAAAFRALKVPSPGSYAAKVSFSY